MNGALYPNQLWRATRARHRRHACDIAAFSRSNLAKEDCRLAVR